ncbi:hypothetical protein BBO99_00006368 [Phytophthora kernoviae]|uniref:Uncharacterized protein n=2 Tax=Phytophthora kernoviae TaxID=325452 RepID=A0A421F4T1_9STRA|nr:hypothetical protein G195_009261 [Phytophthora kernoviae 00238/432]KAG2521777.1 hypothetical protein JM16_006131 [Phytophthora kernoviae]KAG2523142.1 hypothetical protein JM18_005821 [Phytophthora kernoviae]RLN21512.1 hypothetical protein BBI17_005619 [Phytophthora kernoviae]RLN77913.1 hypothetical protein BBO99_00006368 [Phytophthora kernoviae]
MDHPVECGMECIQQSDDCTLEVIGKISVVASVAVKSVTVGLFGQFAGMAKLVKHAVYCAMSLLTVTRAIIRYVRNIKTSDPQAPFDKIMAVLYRTNSVVIDLPVAILSCWGKSVSEKVFFADKVLATTQFILRQVLNFDDELVLSWEKFKAFMKRANFTEPASKISDGEIGSLEDAMISNSTCAFDLKSLTDRTWNTIIDLRAENPDITEDELRIRIQDTQLVKTDIATVTNNCMPQLISESDEETAYKTRYTLRKTFGVIVNDLIKSGRSDNGSRLAAKETAFYVIDRGFTAITVTGMDFMGLSSMIAEYLQVICGPTQFIGEIDDVIFTFKSTDTKNVTVNIMSGGDKIAEVDVCAGGTVMWRSNVSFLGGKTLYLDRWRPGVFGLPGTGGGSLLLWVPKASEGGHLELEAKLNVS